MHKESESPRRSDATETLDGGLDVHGLDLRPNHPAAPRQLKRYLGLAYPARGARVRASQGLTSW